MRSLVAWFVAVGMVGAALAGCGGSSGTPLGPGANPNGGVGGPPVNNSTFQLRVLNGSPDFGAIDVYVDGTRVWQNVKYGTFGTTAAVANAPFYVTTFQPTAHNVAVVAAGATLSTATTQATATTSLAMGRTTIVVADKVFGTLVTPALVALTFAEPTLTAPGASVNVILHHSAPSGAAGTIAYGSLAATSASSAPGALIIPTFIGTLTFANPPNCALPGTRSIGMSCALLPFVNSGGNAIGYYVANTGTANQTIPLACFAPGGPPGTQPLTPPCAVSQFLQPLGAYPTPPPPIPGQTSVPADSGNTLPSTNTDLDPNNLSIYAVDVAPPPGQTIPGVGLIGVFDPNTL
jgi:hypothetical protein